MADRYTKAVLTIIAGALVVIASENAIQSSRGAQSDLQKVALCDYMDRCASLINTSQVASYPIYGLRVSA